MADLWNGCVASLSDIDCLVSVWSLAVELVAGLRRQRLDLVNVDDDLFRTDQLRSFECRNWRELPVGSDCKIRFVSVNHAGLREKRRSQLGQRSGVKVHRKLWRVPLHVACAFAQNQQNIVPFIERMSTL